MHLPSLCEISLRNFKSYQSGSLKLSPLTLLIGANASGKSNLVEGLRLLRWLALGHHLDELQRGQSDDFLPLRGSIQDQVYQGGDGQETSFGLGCALHQPEWDRLSLSIETGERRVRISHEEVRSSGVDLPLYQAEPAIAPAPNILLVTYNNFSRGGNKPRIRCTDTQAVFTQLGTPARFEARHETAQEVIPQITERIRSALSNILFLDPTPSRMREPAFLDQVELATDGSNISSVLAVSCESSKHKEWILSFVRDLPEQNILDIDFERGFRDQVMLSLTESFGGRSEKRYATVLSDGTLRVLAIAAALSSARPGALVVIEEIDNGLHPSRARMLLDRITEMGRERGLKVLLTTHNPALMDALPLERVADVVYCHRHPQTGESVVTRLGDMERLPSIMAQGSLGQVVQQGVVERSLANLRDSTPESRLRWLDGLEERLTAA